MSLVGKFERAIAVLAFVLPVGQGIIQAQGGTDIKQGGLPEGGVTQTLPGIIPIEIDPGLRENLGVPQNVSLFTMGNDPNVGDAYLTPMLHKLSDGSTETVSARVLKDIDGRIWAIAYDYNGVTYWAAPQAIKSLNLSFIEPLDLLGASDR